MKTDYKIGDWIALLNGNESVYSIRRLTHYKIDGTNLRWRETNDSHCIHLWELMSLRLATPEEIIKAGGIPNEAFVTNSYELY